jgi:hypothetical protein
MRRVYNIARQILSDAQQYTYIFIIILNGERPDVCISSTTVRKTYNFRQRCISRPAAEHHIFLLCWRLNSLEKLVATSR